MLNRKQLPPYGKINKKVNIDELKKFIVSNNYNDYSLYNDINYSTATGQKKFLVANGYCKENFFKEKDAEYLEGEKYKQLYLTELDDSKYINTEDVLKESEQSIFSRTRRLDRNSKHYIPEADELNYTKKNEHVRGMFEDILNSFESQITRVRLAVLSPNFEILPHVDYDPSYITRYHIPIFTNDNVKFGIKLKEGPIEFTMPADGSIYFLNTGYPHWVKNNSDEYRLHLIVDTHGQKDLIFVQ